MRNENIDLFHPGYLNNQKRLIYRKDLKPINNLKLVFREIRDYFAGNVTGITRDEKIAQNIMRLLFCKIFDEKYTDFDQLVEFANRKNEEEIDTYKRVNFLFEKVKNKYSDIFNEDEDIELGPLDLSYIISKLEDYSLLDANRDIIADAFEELIGRSFRGGEGQFFTPRNVVDMMVNILQPSSNERVIDPACGSGGFLAHILRNFIKKNQQQHSLYGLDKDLFLSRIAKIYLSLLGEDNYHIFCENSLDELSKWNIDTQDHIQLNSFDVVLTNPPFGAKIPVIGGKLLKQYELGFYWRKIKNDWVLTNNLKEKQPPQILFIERVIQLLKDGGRAGIVLPEGLFGNPSDRYIWEYVKKYASIIGIVSLSQETFQPSTHTKTSIVFLEKNIESKKNIFMAIANTVGHNKNGKEIYRINKDGSYIYDKFGNKVIDDETPEIAIRFSNFINLRLFKESHLGFIVDTNDINENIYIPEHYNPELKQRLKELSISGVFDLITIGELVNRKILQIKRGNEIGSQYYGSGCVPFVRTTDIVNWEIKMDPVKSVADEIYEKYKTPQDIQENDILFVNDGTFLIGRTAIVTRLDTKCIIQSHLRKIRVLKNKDISQYYLFYLLNSKIVQQQIEKFTFVQATLSTLGNRLLDIILPIHKNKQEISRITNEIQEIIEAKTMLRERSKFIIENSP